VSLFVPDMTADPRYTTRGAVHVPAGEGDTRWFSGDVYTVRLGAPATNGALGLFAKYGTDALPDPR
jgi:hypothetical protein